MILCRVPRTIRVRVLWSLAFIGSCVPAVSGYEGIRMRIETLTVPPATGPLAMVVVQNTTAEPWKGEISLQAPEPWQLSPAQRTVAMAAGETRRPAFSISRARNVEANRYPFEILARRDDQLIVHRQETFVASAPYFKASVDGQADEWKDAIPIAFRTGDQGTTISTYWNRRQFSLLVAVEEERLTPMDGETSCDAVQFAISPLPSPEDPSDPKSAGRFEFLLVAMPDGRAKCFQLATYETTRVETAQLRPLAALVCEDAEVAVLRLDNVTYYECSVPFRLMGGRLQPSEGREFHFSVLVHDPDGTGLRELAREAGLWPTADDRRDWSDWPGARWGDVPPLGNKVRWGLCTSKY
ncbi:MAG: hypothetical protein KJ000_13200 [Pirellulaceae bacterium]|nr:hypothetical protein [Pirellulaceae bacterium]